MNEDRDEYDWIFDYTLQFLESEKFDASVMDFIDEKCALFENAEENRLIYTDVHNEFRDHIEALISSNLGELGITTELFLDSCAKSRNNRHINQVVFERLTAIDDFETFKKVMVKRNIELQIEAMQYFSNEDMLSSDGMRGHISATESFRRTSSDFEAKRVSDHHGAGDMDDDKVQDILQQSLLELEIMHRQAELEAAELEAALALSLAIEEDRLRGIIQAADYDSFEQMNRWTRSSDAKGGNDSDSKGDYGYDCSDKKSGASRTGLGLGAALVSAPVADPKQQVKNSSLLKALPPIVNQSEIANEVQLLDNKRRELQFNIEKNQKCVAEQKKLENQLKSQLDPNDTDKRAQFMKEQRDKLVAMKKIRKRKKKCWRKKHERKNRRTAAFLPWKKTLKLPCKNCSSSSPNHHQRSKVQKLKKLIKN